MIPNFDVIQQIWSKSEPRKGDYFHMATLGRDNGKAKGFKLAAWKFGDRNIISEQPYGKDLFFAPLLFSSPERKNSTAVRPGVLFADLDGADYPKLTPSVIWETSKGNTQAVWFLAQPMPDVERWSRVNHALAKYTQADVGTWVPNKLLRVPASINWKRQELGGRVELNYDLVYYITDVEYMLHDYLNEITGTEKGSYPLPLAAASDFSTLVVKNWSRLSLQSRYLLLAKPTDRSLHLIKTAHNLLKDGLEKDVVFQLLWTAPFNKWRTTRFNPEYLWLQICSIVETLTVVNDT